MSSKRKIKKTVKSKVGTPVALPQFGEGQVEEIICQDEFSVRNGSSPRDNLDNPTTLLPTVVTSIPLTIETPVPPTITASEIPAAIQQEFFQEASHLSSAVLSSAADGSSLLSKRIFTTGLACLKTDVEIKLTPGAAPNLMCFQLGYIQPEQAVEIKEDGATFRVAKSGIYRIEFVTTGTCEQEGSLDVDLTHRGLSLEAKSFSGQRFRLTAGLNSINYVTVCRLSSKYTGQLLLTTECPMSLCAGAKIIVCRMA